MNDFQSIVYYFSNSIYVNPDLYDPRSIKVWNANKVRLHSFAGKDMIDSDLIPNFSLPRNRISRFQSFMNTFASNVDEIKFYNYDEFYVYAYTNFVLCDVMLMAHMFNEIKFGDVKVFDPNDLMQLRKYVSFRFDFQKDSGISNFDRRFMNTTFMMFRLLSDKFVG